MKIKFPEEVFEDLKKELEWDGKEKAAFLLCHRSSSNNNVSLLVHEILVPEEPDYVVRSHSICEVRKSFINRVYKGAIETQSDVIKVHTHPPGFPAIFSPIDESHEPKFIRHIDSKIEGMEHASLVFSSAFDSVDGWHYEPDSDEFLPVEKVSIIRKDSLEILLPFRSQLSGKALDPALDRTALAFGEGRVKKNGCLDIGVIGAGGLGSAIIELIARDRPKSVLISDPDVIELTNLNRLVGATQEDIGRNKAEFYAEYVKTISPDTEVKAYRSSFYEPAVQKELTQTDFTFGCVDSGARHAINQQCSAHMIPYFDLGAMIQSKDGNTVFIGGQVFSVVPGKHVCLSCSGVFDSLLSDYLTPQDRVANAAQGYIDGDNTINSPLVAHLDFFIASLGYYEALKYVVGLPGTQSFKVYFDQLNDKISRSNCKTEKCLVCREDGFLGKGDKVPFLYPDDGKVNNKILTLLEAGKT